MLSIYTLISAVSLLSSTPSWHISGTLSEACTCSVPCTCNFGQAPGPHHFCYAVVAMHIDHGNYGDTDLSGLEFGGANAAKGYVFYADERANADQKAALKDIARQMYMKALKANGLTDPAKAPEAFRYIGFESIPITQEIGGKANNIKLGKNGGFSAAYLMGIDDKTPVRVMNNWSFNFADGGIKGKTRYLKYHDHFGNDFDFNDTNANQGRFDWTDQTPVYFR